jgi:hypothetical protein
MESFFLIDEESASKARMKALKLAVQESKLAQEYADIISDFVKEGFSVEAY